MQSDEQAIRELVDTWLTASKAGDLATQLDLLADDVVFMVPGKEPFGKEDFAENVRQMKDVQIDATSNIKEISVLGNWAWMRIFLTVTVTPNNETARTQSGYVLSILRKNANGHWIIARDANLLTAKPEE
jgi:uncharacterized protein (TIGR02246 family)